MLVMLTAAAAVHAVTPSAATAQFVRTGGATTAACASGISVCDVNWSVSWFDTAGPFRGSLGNAAILTSIPAPPWAPNQPGVQQWIGANSAGSVGGSTRYFFQTTFTQTVSGVLSFGLGWDNRMVGAYVGGSVNMTTGLFEGGVSLLPGTSPSTPYLGGAAGFCRGDGVFPSAQWPDCVLNVALGVTADQANTLTFVVEGDGTTDGLLVGSATGTNDPPVIDAPPSTTVPEPSTVVLLTSGLLVLAFGARFKRAAR